MSKHPIVHVEFAAHDPMASAKFYNELFGWPITEVPEFNYAIFDAGDGVGGGFTTIGEASGTKSGDVLVYVSTDDIEASLAKAVSLGSTVISQKMEVPGQGWFAVFTDPGGNHVALWTSAPR